jgi:SAM-dependent methyltransferase
MTQPAEPLIEKFFGNWEHPYRRFEREVEKALTLDSVLLDAGCGRSAPVLQKYRGRVKQLIGVDCVEFTARVDGVELHNRYLHDTNLPNESVDVVMARSVMEHVANPADVFAEMRRVLKPGGQFIFLTANAWDYATVIARLVPNKAHPWIVRKVEGRLEQDVFPTAYKVNTRRAVEAYARDAGLRVSGFQYLGQYPTYLLFSKPLFLLGTLYEKTIAAFPRLHCLRGWILVTLVKPVI